jgi:hypothetical protein
MTKPSYDFLAHSRDVKYALAIEIAEDSLRCLGVGGAVCEDHGDQARRGLQWWNAFFRRGEFTERPHPRREPAKHRRDTGKPAVTLIEAIAAHERVVGYLVAATAAERAALEELYDSAGRDERTGTFPPARTSLDDAAHCPETGHADLEARLFGSFEVRYRGQMLAPWPSQRAASLLKFLLLHRGRAVRREVLMDAFWPGSSAKSARNNLNVTVYQLRQRRLVHRISAPISLRALRGTRASLRLAA